MADAQLAGEAAAAVRSRLIDALLLRRTIENRRFFDAEAERLAELCRLLAARFTAGGRLVACAATPAGRSDARHVAVEFVHPVIVGKRALPALALAPEGGPVIAQAMAVLRPADVVMAFGADERAEPAREEVAGVIRAARRLGCETVAFANAGAAWEFSPQTPDPFVRQELIETFYHVVWELVHVFLDHAGLRDASGRPAARDAGGSAFLYPFLNGSAGVEEGLLEDVRRSARMKSREVGELRERTISAARGALADAAARLRALLDAGGTVLAVGNGGSATDAMDAVADLRLPPDGLPPRRALDLTEDAAILTAIGNDIGCDALFARQVIAYGHEGDALIAFSTSGGSRNVVHALEEAGRRGLYTVAFVGYDGGAIAAGPLADCVVVSPSQNIPRVQEAQATAWHVLRELIETGRT